MPYIDDKIYKRDQTYRKIMFIMEIVILLVLTANLVLTGLHLSEHWRVAGHVEKGL